MIAGGIIHNLPGGGLVGIAAHIDDEIAVVDAVLAFVEKDACAHRARVNDLMHFSVGFPSLIERAAADPAIHGHAPYARHYSTEIVNAGAIVGRTLPNAGRIRAIGPEHAGFDVAIGIPVAFG